MDGTSSWLVIVYREAERERGRVIEGYLIAGEGASDEDREKAKERKERESNEDMVRRVRVWFLKGR